MKGRCSVEVISMANDQDVIEFCEIALNPLGRHQVSGMASLLDGSHDRLDKWLSSSLAMDGIGRKQPHLPSDSNEFMHAADMEVQIKRVMIEHAPVLERSIEKQEVATEDKVK